MRIGRPKLRVSTPRPPSRHIDGPALCRAIAQATTLALGVALAACAATAPLSGRPSLNTARVALSSGAGGLALNICNTLLAQNPRDTDLLTCRGDAMTALGRPAEATAAYRSALAISPHDTRATIGLGRLRLATSPAEAEALFLQALAQDPRNPVALNDLGIARDLQGRHADAQTAYAQAIALQPGLRAAQVNLALSFALSGRAAEAVRMLRPIGESAGATLRERHDLAAALAMDGKQDEAARLLGPDLNNTQVDEALRGFRALPPR